MASLRHLGESVVLTERIGVGRTADGTHGLWPSSSPDLTCCFRLYSRLGAPENCAVGRLFLEAVNRGRGIRGLVGICRLPF